MTRDEKIAHQKYTKRKKIMHEKKLTAEKTQKMEM